MVESFEIFGYGTKMPDHVRQVQFQHNPTARIPVSSSTIQPHAFLLSAPLTGLVFVGRTISRIAL